MWIDDPPRPLALGSVVKFSSFFGITVSFAFFFAMCLFSISGFLFGEVWQLSPGENAIADDRQDDGRWAMTYYFSRAHRTRCLGFLQLHASAVCIRASQPPANSLSTFHYIINNGAQYPTPGARCCCQHHGCQCMDSRRMFSYEISFRVQCRRNSNTAIYEPTGHEKRCIDNR